MDTINYLKTKSEMCKCKCKTCPLSLYNNEYHVDCTTFEFLSPEDAVKLVENWRIENSTHTRQYLYRKLFPNTNLVNGVLDVCPKTIDSRYKLEHDCDDSLCENCMREYWSKEVSYE